MPEMARAFPARSDRCRRSIPPVLIPATRTALHLVEHELGWMDRKPAWGPGRDDAFNLPKYILTQTPWDDTRRQYRFSGGMAARQPQGAALSLGRRSEDALRRGRDIGDRHRVVAGRRLRPSATSGSKTLSPRRSRRPIPAPIDASLADRGKAIYPARCAELPRRGRQAHRHRDPARRDRHRPRARHGWQQRNADRMNLVVRALGAADADVQGAQGGYVARPLVGVWLLGPYLHNGSVPTLCGPAVAAGQRARHFLSRLRRRRSRTRSALSRPATKRRRNGFRFDTALRGNGNGGHEYGTDLGDADKRALLEYLKTL